MNRQATARHGPIEAFTSESVSPSWERVRADYYAEYLLWGASHGADDAFMETDTALAIWLTSEHPAWAWKTASHAVTAIGSAFEAAGRPSPRHGELVRRVLSAYRRGRRVAMSPTEPFGPRQLTLPIQHLTRRDREAAAFAAVVSSMWVTSLGLPEMAALARHQVHTAPGLLRLDGQELLASVGPLQACAVRNVTTLLGLAPEDGHPFLWPLADPQHPDDLGRIVENARRLIATAAKRLGFTSLAPLSVTGSEIGIGTAGEDEVRVLASAGTAGGVLEARDRALLLCGLGHRAMDMSRLDLRTVVTGDDATSAVLPRSKSDLAGRGRPLWWDHTGSMHCPHCALQDWILVLRHLEPAWSGPLFPTVRGLRVEPDRIRHYTVTRAVRVHCERVGLPPASYSSRSLRVGGTTALAEAGADLEELAQVTGHLTAESAAMYWRFDTITPARLPV